jgi:hypothetical protein
VRIGWRIGAYAKGGQPKEYDSGREPEDGSHPNNMVGPDAAGEMVCGAIAILLGGGQRSQRVGFVFAGPKLRRIHTIVSSG